MLLVATIAFLSATALGVVATLVVRGWARRVEFVDRPGGRKQHGNPTPLGGGIAILVAVFLPVVVGAAVLWLLQGSPRPNWVPAFAFKHAEGVAAKLPLLLGLMGGAGVLLVMGLIDDRRALGAGVKFAVQFTVALLTVWLMGVRAAEALSAPLSIALTVLWIVLITNAFNFLDNMDGLSAGVAMIAALVFALTSMRAGQVFVPLLALTLAGALAGFLWFNFVPASIFMGDAGSNVIGYLLAVLTVLTTFYNPDEGTRPLGLMVPIVVLAVPLYDVISVVSHRIRAGQSPLQGDRRHFSHRLVKKGLSPRGAVLTIYLATAATGLPAIALPHVDWLNAALLMLQCVCVVVMVAVLEHLPGGAHID